MRCDWIASHEDASGNGALRRHLPDDFRINLPAASGPSLALLGIADSG